MLNVGNAPFDNDGTLGRPINRPSYALRTTHLTMRI
jgi:hypothetical protein